MTYAQSSMANQITSASAEISTMLVELLIVFQRQGISYCYWKSSRRVSLALAGATDLDLLVARRSREQALNVLFASGFKLILAAPYRDHPAVMSFLGYDETSGKILHVHVHFWIVLGNALLKTYRLPYEDLFIARSNRHPSLPIRILDPLDEALLLMVRSSFELRRMEPITVRRWKEMKEKFALDFADLLPRINAAEFFGRTREIFTADLAHEIASKFTARTPFRSLGNIRRRIETELKPYGACGAAEAFVRTWGRVVLWGFGELNRHFFHLPRLPRRRPIGGGVVIAIVGVDGSGKSTLVSTLRAWLEREVDVLPIYFGTGGGRPSLILLPFKQLVPLVARFIKTKPRGASHGEISDRPASLLYSLLFAIWATAVAAEKRHKLILSRRAASRGFIVVTDRYPQNEIPSFNDGPLLHRLDYVPKWLRRFEVAVYDFAYRTPPDVVIKLHINAETVARREPDMHPRIVRQRVESFVDLTFGASRIVSIDSERPLEEVVKMVRREVWTAF